MLKEYRRQLISTLLTVAVLIVIGTVVMQRQGKGFSVKIDQNTLRIEGEMPCLIQLDQLDNLAWIDQLQTGEAVDGRETHALCYGKYHSEAWGDYMLFAYKGVAQAIFLQDSEGSFVLNFADEKMTQAFYDELMDYVSNRKWEAST